MQDIETIKAGSPSAPAAGFAAIQTADGDLKPWAAYLIILGVVAAIVLPIAFIGIPDGFDLMQHIRFAAAYRDALVSGELIPRWAANDNFGFGSIGIRYYPPLAYYVLALTRIMTGNWYDSFWITALGWTYLGCVGVYLWVKEWTSSRQAMAAAVLYVIVPYHTFQIYQAVFYAEFIAAALFPFCFLFLTRVCLRGRWADVAFLSVAFALLVLSHIPTTIIASPCLAIYGLLIFRWTDFKNLALKFAVAGVAAIAASAFYLAKAISEVNWVWHNSSQYFASGYYNYTSYFFPIVLSATSARYIERNLWQIDTLILLTFALFGPCIVVLLLKRGRVVPHSNTPRFGRAILLTGLFSIFMLSTASALLWNSISILQKIQFPWRWLSVASLLGSAAFAASAAPLITAAGRWRRFVAYSVVGFLMVTVFFDVTQNIIPSTPLTRSDFEQKVASMDNEEGCDCWWPIWANKAAFKDKANATAAGRDVNILDWASTSREFSISAGSPGDLRVATFYHPYWHARLNGSDAAVAPDAGGAILVSVPGERSTMTLTFEEPALLRNMTVVSVAAWVTILLFLILNYFRRGTRGLNEN